MKRHISAVFILTISLLLVLPSASYSWSRGHYRPYRYYGCGGCCNGWAVGAVIVGGIIAGAVVGDMIARSAVSGPPPRSAYPSSGPRVAYAYPDPAFVARYSKKKPHGEWVTVPAQSVDGKWVPEHKVLVPIQSE